MIRIGTSGYSYKDWVGPFYPPGTKPADYLAYYARHLNTCEINYTYYRPPDPRTLARMVEKSAGRVHFVVKANQEMTHSRQAADADYRSFKSALAPLIDSDTFGCILAQFPYSFKPQDDSRDYLVRLKERFSPLPVVVEFRHQPWVTEETFELLKRNDLGFCCVDEPRLKGLMPPIAEATSGIGYVRFHGRNAEKWWNHESPEQRYDYRYDKQELAEWAPKIRELEQKTKTTYIFTNNHFQAKAIDNARMLMELLL